MSEAAAKDILIVEPFNGGSHGQLIKLLLSDSEIGPRCEVISLPAKKWHWRARTSALYFSQTIPFSNYRVIFSSSVLNLAELIALRPDLARLKKIVYFHENQLVYPVREVKERDFQYGYNQILTSLVADVAVFNSSFNMESFLSSISSHLKLIPDHRPKNLEAIIRPKCIVLNFPVNIDQNIHDCGHPVDFTRTSNNDQSIQNNDRLSEQNTDICVDDRDNKMLNDEQGICIVNAIVQKCCTNSDKGFEHCGTGSRVLSFKPTDLENDKLGNTHCDIERNVTEVQDESYQHHPVLENRLSEPFKGNNTCLHIVWPHRWEHDKDPESFFKAILQLQSEGFDFCVSVVGETFTDVADIFHLAKPQLADKIVAWGFQTRQNYLKILDSAHVAVSTALHEFFGVSMLEATGHGCYPLCPKRLVYPEIYPEECLYSTHAQLVKRLRRFCQRPDLAKADQFKGLVERFSWCHLQEEYRKLLLE